MEPLVLHCGAVIVKRRLEPAYYAEAVTCIDFVDQIVHSRPNYIGQWHPNRVSLPLHWCRRRPLWPHWNKVE